MAGQNEKSKMYQGSAPMTREIEMPDEYHRHLAGRPTFCNGHEEKDQLRMISRTPIILKPSLEPEILILFIIHNEIGGVIVVVLHKNPSIIPYLLFIFCTIGIIRNIVLCMDSRMGLGVTHLYLDVGGWLNWSLASVSGGYLLQLVVQFCRHERRGKTKKYVK